MTAGLRSACVTTLVLAGLMAGCAHTSSSSPAAMADSAAYKGEVWTWDSETNVVTLRQGVQTIRVKTTPDQIRALRLHDTAVVHGQLVGPADIATVIVPSPPMAAVPRGPATMATTPGTVVAVNPTNVIAIDSPHGRQVVWGADGASSRFASGSQVQLDVAVQAMDLVPETAQTASSATPSASPSVPATSEPGDHASVVGRVLSSDPAAGLVTVDSPRGPVTVWVPNAATYPAGTTVRVTTSLRPS